MFSRQTKFLYLIERENIILANREYKRFQFAHTTLKRYHTNKKKGIQLFDPIPIFNISNFKQELQRQIDLSVEMIKPIIRTSFDFDNLKFKKEDVAELIDIYAKRSSNIKLINYFIYFSNTQPISKLKEILDSTINEYKFNNNIYL